MMTDVEIKERALAEFTLKAPRKFDAGMREHNPDGTRGMWRMDTKQLAKAAKEEVIDLWHYLVVLENKIQEQNVLIQQLKHTINKHNE
tara:strand:+ start:1230 stop:1493 length:264 start_codon:yes stop_codon:yes gene_type:complete